MKKIKLIAATALLVATLLAACGKKSTAPSSSSSSSSKGTETSTIVSSSPATTDTPSTTENPLTVTFAKMDIEAISQGDFSSIIGTWRSDDGRLLTFNSVGLVADSNPETVDGFKMVEGALETVVKTKDGSQGGYRLVMIPSEVKIPGQYFNTGDDDTDMHQDRMIGSQQNLNKASDYKPFYRLPPKTNIESNPLTNDDTGVRLESGQNTIDYANSILGLLNWKIIESNYNRTESIPFELLQGENGWLYRVYRNGVILSQTKNVIIYMP